MAYHKFVRRIQPGKSTSGPKADRYISSHRSCFDPTPCYGSTYTERQLAIIRGEAVPGLRVGDVSLVINKAEYLGDYEIAEQLYTMYGDMYHPREKSDPSYDEAIDILDELTPGDLK